MHSDRLSALALALCLAGLVVAPIGSTLAATGHPADGQASANATETAPPDPPDDRLGWEQGYWYNESIDVDQSDGLSAAELRRYKARTMARLERIRGLEFTGDVPVQFIGPAEVGSRLDENVTQFRGSPQQWEALFVVGDGHDTRQVLLDTLVANVAGWAAEEGADSVVLVTDTPEDPSAPYALLAHELVHVLQDQQFALSAERYQRTTMDGEHAKDALVEGEAAYIQHRYERNCTSGHWDCVEGGDFATGTARGDFDLLPYLGAPYSRGAQYVAGLVERGGYAAVNAVHRDPPQFSVQALVSNSSVAPDDPLILPDRSTAEWERQSGPERVGAMGLLADFESVATAWRNGALYGYANDSASAFVWETHWANADAAASFAGAYAEQIRRHGGESIGDARWQISDGEYADVFSIERFGRTVRIVNAPDVDSLAAVHASPGMPDRESTTIETRTDVDDSTTGRETSTATADPSPPADSTTAAENAPGFGVLAALSALVALTFAKVYSRR